MSWLNYKIASQQALLFCEQKSSKKNFMNLVLWRFQHRAKRTKSFLVLFFKKARLDFCFSKVLRWRLT